MIGPKSEVKHRFAISCPKYWAWDVKLFEILPLSAPGNDTASQYRTACAGRARSHCFDNSWSSDLP
jgi:hypothetical protein